MTATLDTEAIQDAVAGAIRAFLNEREAEITTPIIDVPAKNVTGNYCAAELLPALFATLEERIAPDELGRRWKAVGMPIPIALPALAWAYELGRTQRYLDRGWPAQDVDLGDSEEAARVLRYWAGVMQAYRNDGGLLPGVDGVSRQLRILPDADVASLAQRTLAGSPPQDVKAVRRAFAQLGLYAFVLHAEDRLGMFNHGPYPLANGRVLVVKEFTDLQNRWLPWVRPEHRLAHSRLVVPLVLEGVECEFDLFGTLFAAPDDYLAHAEAMVVLAGDDLAPIDEAALIDVARQAQRAQPDLFRTFAGWDQHYMAAHGGVHFANVFAVVLTTAGFSDDEIRELLWEPFDRCGQQVAERVLDGAGANVWEHVAAAPPPVFPCIAR